MARFCRSDHSGRVLASSAVISYRRLTYIYRNRSKMSKGSRRRVSQFAVTECPDGSIATIVHQSFEPLLPILTSILPVFLPLNMPTSASAHLSSP